MGKSDSTTMQLRPTDRDLDNVKVIEQAHPELSTVSDVLRHALETARRAAEREMKQLTTP